MCSRFTPVAVRWRDERCDAAAAKEALAALPDAAPDERRTAGSGGGGGGGGSTADASDASSDQFSGAPAAGPVRFWIRFYAKFCKPEASTLALFSPLTIRH